MRRGSSPGPSTSCEVRVCVTAGQWRTSSCCNFGTNSTSASTPSSEVPLPEIKQRECQNILCLCARQCLCVCVGVGGWVGGWLSARVVERERERPAASKAKAFESKGVAAQRRTLGYEKEAHIRDCAHSAEARVWPRAVGVSRGQFALVSKYFLHCHALCT